MAIITFDKDDVIEYVPVSERNSENPTVVLMKHVTFAVAQKYQKMIAAQVKGMGGFNPEKIAENTRMIQKKQFCENVIGVRNFFVKGREISTSAELYEAADSKLIIELINAMEDSARLTEGQLKNFAQESGTASGEEKAS
ncbi:MAG TPA: hypothetical protein DCS42_04620 [Nitrospiraceae bacterium]|nr:hypothetical protein [Nitrospiraceae bacterium]